MLHFILAGQGAGKSTLISSLIKEYALGGKERISLIVPEQYSFTAEKNLLSYLGEYAANRVDVLTFTSLAENILKEYGRRDKARLSASSSAVLMSMALASVRDKLTVYGRHADRVSSVREFLSLESEFKQNAISASMIDEKLAAMPDSLLKAKLADISLILKAYDEKVGESYFNPEDALTELDSLAELDAYLNGRVLFIDSFRGFTAQEYLIINHILARCSEIYISLCAENLDDCGDLRTIMTETFAKTKRTAGRLIDEAKKLFPGEGKVYDIIRPGKFERYRSPELFHLEKVFSLDSEEIYEGECSAIELYSAPDIYSECETAAAVIKKLIREKGYRCRDIAVIARKAESYERPFRSALRKAGISVYEDYRKSADVSPVINAVSAVLAAAADNFGTDSVMRWLKSGLTGLNEEEVSSLENYAFVWNISGRKWTDEWKNNPNGFGDGEVNPAVLEYLNRIKDKAIKPVALFRQKIRGGVTGETALTALWDMLTGIGFRENTLRLAQRLVDDGEEGAALEIERMWDILTSLLTELNDLIGEEKVTASKLSDYFEIMLQMQTVGTLPQGLDEIILGSADRIRISSPRAVVILGANEGVFPPEAGIVSALNMKDRERMSEIGLELSDSPEWKLADEKLIVYSSLCCPREKLIITCSRTGLSGEEMNPCEFYNKIKRIFVNIKEESSEALGGMFFVEGRQPAFEQYALTADATLGAALREYFEKDGEYKDKLSALDFAAHSREFELRDGALVSRLYNDRLTLSASKIETFHKCGFQYFCKYALRLGTLNQAKLDSLFTGNITHMILEVLLRDPGIDALSTMKKEEIEKNITETADRYLGSYTSGGLDTERMKYQYNVLKRVACEVIDRIIEEFRHSAFRPEAFEQVIGEGGIGAYEPEGSGGTVRVEGKIDRVDTAVSPLTGKEYLRVIDYKTGGRDFKFGDILRGFNLQMLIYLFALENSGKGQFGDFDPAGVLYYTAGSRIINDGNKDDEKKAKRMGGVVLEDADVITLMEDDAAGIYIPANITDKGKIKGTTVTKEGFERLRMTVDRLINEMAGKLREGYISAKPKRSSSGSPCDYCDFKAVCGYEEGSGQDEKEGPDEKTAKKIIMGEEEENDERGEVE